MEVNKLLKFMDKLPKTSQPLPSSLAADSGGRAYWCLGGPFPMLSYRPNKNAQDGS